MKKPNFLIVGAAKSGTTSLYHYLKQHPDIFMPTLKEPQYFVKDKVRNRIHKGVYDKNEYYSLFKESQEKLIGEASVFYLFYYKEAIQNIIQELGNEVKIIIVLRNPIERSYSAYQHVSRNNVMESLSFEMALEKEAKRLEKNPNLTPMVCYQAMGLYSDAVKAYREAFKNVLVVLYDDLQSNPKNFLNEIGEFLEVQGLDDVQIKKHNVGGWSWKHPFLKRLFLSKSPIKTVLKNVPGLKYIVSRFKSSSSENLPPMHDETREMLRAYYAEDIKLLSKYINKELAWE